MNKKLMINLCNSMPFDNLIQSIELAGVSRSTIYSDALPSSTTIIKLCKAWGCTPNDILKGLY